MFLEANRWLRGACDDFGHSLKICILPLLILASFTSADPTVTIASSNAYMTQRPCVQACVWAGLSNGGGNVGYSLGCSWNPSLNSCWCRADLQSSATSILSACASQNCQGNAVDISNAVSLYTAYCATATATALAATTSVVAVPSTTAPSTPSSTAVPPTTAPSTTAPSPMASSSGSSTTTSSSPPPGTSTLATGATTLVYTASSRATPMNTTPSSVTPSASPSSGKLPQSDLIAIVGVLVSAFGGVVAAYCSWRVVKHKRNKRQQIANNHGIPLIST